MSRDMVSKTLRHWQGAARLRQPSCLGSIALCAGIGPHTRMLAQSIALQGLGSVLRASAQPSQAASAGGVDLASEEARAYIDTARQIEGLNRTLRGLCD